MRLLSRLFAVYVWLCCRPFGLITEVEPGYWRIENTWAGRTAVALALVIPPVAMLRLFSVI